jgi:hypothetical protein
MNERKFPKEVLEMKLTKSPIIPNDLENETIRDVFELLISKSLLEYATRDRTILQVTHQIMLKINTKFKYYFI